MIVLATGSSPRNPKTSRSITSTLDSDSILSLAWLPITRGPRRRRDRERYHPFAALGTRHDGDSRRDRSRSWTARSCAASRRAERMHAASSAAARGARRVERHRRGRRPTTARRFAPTTSVRARSRRERRRSRDRRRRPDRRPARRDRGRRSFARRSRTSTRSAITGPPALVSDVDGKAVAPRATRSGSIPADAASCPGWGLPCPSFTRRHRRSDRGREARGAIVGRARFDGSRAAGSPARKAACQARRRARGPQLLGATSSATARPARARRSARDDRRSRRRGFRRARAKFSDTGGGVSRRRARHR